MMDNSSSQYLVELKVEETGIRLDSYLVSKLSAAFFSAYGIDYEFSRNQISNFILNKQVNLNSLVCSKSSKKVSAGDLVLVSFSFEDEIEIKPDYDIDLNIVFEDEEIIVINKQAGLIVHPGAGVIDKTLVNALVAYLGEELKQIGDSLRPGIVHRLDKDTSGLMVIAKTQKTHLHLKAQFEEPRTIFRKYLAICLGFPETKGDGPFGRIEGNIARDSRDRKKMAIVSEGGKPAATNWRLIEELNFANLLELSLETGRTHQIRVHLASQGVSVFGDPVYKTNSYFNASNSIRSLYNKFARQALHAYRLEFIHPKSGLPSAFEVDLPEDMLELKSKIQILK